MVVLLPLTERPACENNLSTDSDVAGMQAISNANLNSFEKQTALKAYRKQPMVLPSLPSFGKLGCSVVVVNKDNCLKTIVPAKLLTITKTI